MENMEELKKRLSTTNDAGLIAILFEKLIENFKNSIVAMEKGEGDSLSKLINHSRAILTELTVQFSGADRVSSTIREINIFINKAMTEGEIKGDKSLFEGNIRVLTPILEAFKELEIKEKPKAVSGLTYGKDNLGEYTLNRNKSFEG